MFTFENTKEATHKIGSYFKKIIPGNMPEFLSKDGVWLLSSFSVKSALTHKSLIELSRPPGERKEDHTDENGVVTYALQPFSPQVIEPYVADQLDDLINPVSEGCQAGDPPLTVEQHQEILDDLAENDKPVRIGSPIEPYEWTEKHDEQLKSALIRVEQLNKPVFTQEMADNNEMPPIGAKVLYNVCNPGCAISSGNDKYHGAEAHVVAHFRGLAVIVGDDIRFTAACNNLWIKPIDNRSDEDKLIDLLLEDYDISQGEAEALVTDTRFALTLNKE